MKKAVVVGALGVIGKYIVDKLKELSDEWEVVGLSRRKGEDDGNVSFISVDLQNSRDSDEKLAGLTDITHIFYAAFHPSEGNATNIEANRDMLINSVSVIARVSPRLQRVVLVTGTKYYGCHLGPFKTPAKENDPRHMPPNFYYDQIDWLTNFQKECAKLKANPDEQWTWSELRPHSLCGFSPGNVMSIVPIIAVYASISKELGLPLRFPGKPGAYRAIYQLTSSKHFANAALWAATSPQCANESYNLTNGDVIRWSNVWPRIAEVFDMPVGDVQTISLTRMMGDKANLWDNIMVPKYELQPYKFSEVVAWPFGDFVFGASGM